MSAMRQEVERCLGGFRHTVFFLVEAAPAMTTIRLPLLAWFMSLAVWALTINIHDKCTPKRRRADSDSADLERQATAAKYAMTNKIDDVWLSRKSYSTIWRRWLRSMRSKFTPPACRTGRSFPTSWPPNCPTASPPSLRLVGRWGQKNAARCARRRSFTS
jgi:hypothetical protein